MLQPQHIDCAACGEVVTFAIGNVRWSLEFDLALRIAGALGYHSRLAKAIANCGKTAFNVVGVLEDANAPRARRRRFEQQLPEFLRSHDVGVRHVGQMVHLRIGRHTAEWGWEDARRVAKWLRLRGKQARNTARERAHWAQIARVDTRTGEPQC